MDKEFRDRARIALVLVGVLSAVQSLAVFAQTANPKRGARESAVGSALAPGSYQPDTFLIMVNPDADKEEVATALREARGNVLSTIGSGAMTTLVVQTEAGKLEETEQKLAKDKHFGDMQRIAISHGHSISDGNPNDPYFPSNGIWGHFRYLQPGNKAPAAVPPWLFWIRAASGLFLTWPGASTQALIWLLPEVGAVTIPTPVLTVLWWLRSLPPKLTTRYGLPAELAIHSSFQ